MPARLRRRERADLDQRRQRAAGAPAAPSSCAQQGVAALVSFGLAIGLAPVLRPGDVVIADRVVLPGGEVVATDPGWRAGLMQRLQGSGLNLRVARIAGSDEVLTSAGAKRRAFQTTFAAALDTESHRVAEVAAAAGLPLLVVRAVAEPAETMRPGVAFAAIGADGRPRSLAVMGHLARRPWEIPAGLAFQPERPARARGAAPGRGGRPATVRVRAGLTPGDGANRAAGPGESDGGRAGRRAWDAAA